MDINSIIKLGNTLLYSHLDNSKCIAVSPFFNDFAITQGIQISDDIALEKICGCLYTPKGSRYQSFGGIQEYKGFVPERISPCDFRSVIGFLEYDDITIETHVVDAISKMRYDFPSDKVKQTPIDIKVKGFSNENGNIIFYASPFYYHHRNNNKEIFTIKKSEIQKEGDLNRIVGFNVFLKPYAYVDIIDSVPYLITPDSKIQGRYTGLPKLINQLLSLNKEMSRGAQNIVFTENRKTNEMLEFCLKDVESFDMTSLNFNY